MDTQSLQAFIEVAETRSFSKAGERLHLSQPAISKRIAVLEQQLGSALFDRVGRQVTLTAAGRTLLPYAPRPPPPPSRQGGGPPADRPQPPHRPAPLAAGAARLHQPLSGSGPRHPL